MTNFKIIEEEADGMFRIHKEGDWRNLFLKPTELGCGTSGLTNLCNFDLPNDIPLLKRLIRRVKLVAIKDRTGQILFVMGESFWDRWHDLVIDLGFKQVDEYPNMAHSRGPGAYEAQRLYTLKASKNARAV